MATRRITQLTDDTNGQPADETIRFSLDGRDYEIDLSETNAQALREALGPWVDSARRISTGRRAPHTRAPLDTAIDSAAVRAWAASNGIDISLRGRLPKNLVEQYRAAGH
jgi:hypothetical protein